MASSTAPLLCLSRPILVAFATLIALFSRMPIAVSHAGTGSDGAIIRTDQTPSPPTTIVIKRGDVTLVIFSAAGYSWDRSPDLRARLLRAVGHTSVPMFFLHAANDFSTNPGKVLDAELARLGKPHRLNIYPAVGRTPEDGHDFPNNSVAVWEPDVFAFLDRYMR
jgi:hypothetical protein